MEVSSIGGLLRKDQLLERRSLSAIKAHNFALRVSAANYLDGILRQFENFCEQSLQFAICRAFDGWRCDPHSQCTVVLTCNFAARCARHDKYIKDEISTLLGMANQD